MCRDTHVTNDYRMFFFFDKYFVASGYQERAQYLAEVAVNTITHEVTIVDLKITDYASTSA